MMNRLSRWDEASEQDSSDQSPAPLSNELTKCQDLKGIASSGERRGKLTARKRAAGAAGPAGSSDLDDGRDLGSSAGVGNRMSGRSSGREHQAGSGLGRNDGSKASSFERVKQVVMTFGRFVGPGFMVAVAYIDPGNYATDVAAGASYQFRLLFVVLLSNIFAIFLQGLSIKLGSVSGLNLAEACRAFLPTWLNYFLYLMAEAAIIATDMAEVIGTAIALNLLVPRLPLVAACALSILDVMAILLFYRPNGSMKGLRIFELFVMVLVLAVVVCFCIQLSLIKNTAVGQVLKGYLPSRSLVESHALYQACGILGATVMPHSIYLGSGIVQSRLREYDVRRGLLPPPPSDSSLMEDSSNKPTYIPSLSAIRHCLKYSIAEMALSLFTFALFVNSAILIVAGASLYRTPGGADADLFGIYDLLSASIAPAAGTIFALALLLSGISAGIVCTIAGQMVSEGALNWSLRPWLRRLVTRLISITPSIIVAAAVGRSGLNAALTASQVALSIVLPFITAPLIYFTCLNRYMTVQPGMARFGIQGPTLADEETRGGGGGGGGGDAGGAQIVAWRVVWWLRRCFATTSTETPGGPVKMANSWGVVCFGVLVWLMIATMNVANIILLGRGA